jgi:hypothetical protein
MMAIMVEPDLLTPDEVARQLRVSRSTLAKWRCGLTGPPFVRLNGRHGRIVYPRAGLAGWVAGHVHTAPPETGQAA